MRKTIKELPDLKGVSEDDISDLKTNFYIPNLGRFFIDTERVKKKRKFKKLL